MQRGAVVPRASRCPLRPAVSRSPLAVNCCFMAASCSRSLSAKCPYRTLGVTYEANDEEIKGAFRRKAKQMHPDVSRDPIAAIAFMECKHAYQTLVDPEKRAKYDKTLLPRTNSQVLSYLNARSAARHGLTSSRIPTRGASHHSPELYSTMLKLLAQVKSCAKHLEREFVGKDGVPLGLRPPPSTRTAHGVFKHVAVADTDGGELECGEPWFYYTTKSAATVDPAMASAGLRGRR